MHNTIIVGASAAGLACAAQLGKRGIDYKIIESHGHVAHAWRSHYDRLHLHTNKKNSGLPFFPFSSTVGKYPSKAQVIEYLENYAEAMGIRPMFNTTAKRIHRSERTWVVETDNGPLTSRHVIMCTGNAHTPKPYNRPGLDTFPGVVMHSAAYKNGSTFRDKRVLVVGFGNSACEIALCLSEHGAKPALSVRSPVNVIPREILGIPVLTIGIWQSLLPPRLTDRLNKPLLRLLVGDIEKYGLKKLPYGPREQIIVHHRIPLLDVGTMDLIRKGALPVYGDVSRFDGNAVHFADGKVATFDAIITAVGYETGLRDLLGLDADREADLRQPLATRKYLGKDNLYFCGFYVSPTGMLREIALESRVIADQIDKQVKAD